MAGYLVLARKYRPTTFADVLGQDVVTGVLTGALQEKRTGHAYLFSGPRGTGKTTTARILARCLNCVEGPTPTPCGTCTHCAGIDAGNDPDLIEIDAATHTGVDHIRELREQAAYAPMKARHKVYIVDEVHMLSKAAFNALLKTLEEPPPHVVFLFATTELHKVLPTIVSRCQVLKLNPLAEDAIVERLREVLRLEGVTPGPGLLEEIARGARGGMRDALSLADKLLALAGNKPTLDDLRRLGGHAGSREVEALLSKVEAGDKRGLFESVAGYEGVESELISALLSHLRLSLVSALCGEDSPLLPSERDSHEAIVSRGKKLTGERVELWMQELLHARERMRTFPGQERLVLELTLLDLARPEATMTLAELEARLSSLSQDGPPAADPAPSATPRPSAAATPPRELTPAAPEGNRGDEKPAPPTLPAPSTPTADGPSPARIWDELLEALGERHGALATLMRARGTLTLEGGEAIVDMPRLDDAERSMVNDRRNASAVTRALGEVAGRPLQLRIREEGASDDGPPATERKPAASADAFTQEVADLFGGVIEDL